MAGGVCRAGASPGARGPFSQNSASQERLPQAERCVARPGKRHAGRHEPGVRLPWRRQHSLRRVRPGVQLRACVPRATHRARHERAFGRCFSTGALCRRWCGRFHTCSSARCESAAWWASPPRRTCSWGWWRRRFSCGLTFARVSRGELFAIMAGGMASIAGTVLFLYGSILSRVQPDAVAYLRSPRSSRRPRRSS